MPTAHRRLPRWLKAILIVLALIVALVAAGLFYITTPSFQRFVSGKLSTSANREITVDGGFDIDWSHEPRVTMKGIYVGNAEWAKEPVMFSADQVSFTVRLKELLRFRLVFPEIMVEKPFLDLEKNKDGDSNWTFSENPKSAAVEAATPDDRNDIPTIGRLQINDGKIRYADAKTGNDLQMNISTVSGTAERHERVTLSGKGTYKGSPLTLDMEGGSVLQLRDTSEPYPLKLNLVAGPTRVKVEGTMQDPVRREGVDIRLDVQGRNAADLFPLTGIALPPTPPYRLSGHLTSDGKLWQFTGFDGKMGTSDLHGDASWDTAQKPPYLKANLVSNLLNYKDMAGFIGADEKPEDETRVIPDTPLDASKMRAMNADVTFKGKSIQGPQVLDDFAMTLALRNGTLTLKPVSFGIAGGTIDANVTVEGNANPSATMLDARFRRLSLTRLFAPLSERFGEDNVSAGVLGGRAKLKGTGKSLREILGSSTGEVGIGMEGGRLSHILLEAAGLDFFRLAGLLVSGDKPVDIQCVIGDFGVEDGLMTARTLLIDTDVTTLEGEGGINLKNEQIDMRINVHPKEASLFSARAPILVQGRLKKPRALPDPAVLAARGGIAAALGVLLTPAGALLAFVDTGLGEDGPCTQVIRRLPQESQKK